MFFYVGERVTKIHAVVPRNVFTFCVHDSAHVVTFVEHVELCWDTLY